MDKQTASNDLTAPTFAELDDSTKREYWASLALRHCKGIGVRTCAKLLRTFGSAGCAMQHQEQWDKRFLTEMKSGVWRAGAQEEWEQAQQLNSRILLWQNVHYPQLLRELPDAPVLLYVQGDLSLLQSPAVAIVGSRSATPYGCKVANRMAQYLSSKGLAVISGMAKGIDSAAHEGALRHIGSSIGILGTGIDVIYPKSSKETFAKMCQKGLLLSEFAPATPPIPRHFPIRNRIISGLSLGVLIVEATEHSGSLITARLALEQNREVYAVPGAALDPNSLGCQNLIREGAKPVFAPEDILADLLPQLRAFSVSEQTEQAKLPEPQILPPPNNNIPKPRKIPDTFAPDSKEAKILQCLFTDGAMQIDNISLALNLPPHELNPLLLNLEILGHIKRLPGAYFEAV